EEMALSSDATSARSAIMEIRPGVGGEEASLFAGELLEMYTRLAGRKGWDVQLMDVAHSDLGGLKYGTLAIEGEDVYKFLKFETGAHRVQRVPRTEASGRIHTSIATVAVLPQVDDVEIEINPQDVRTDTYSAGGPGGQHVNKTQSAVRLTHLPTNIVVQCQDQRSQTRNRELAWKALKTKLFEHFEDLKAKERRDLRRTQVGTGDRSDKIRTYNYPDNRITDTRLGASGSVHNLEGFLQGDMDELMERLLKWEREEKLKALAKKA
ncbi:MAG TPA: PCRF domain-containing protein, partial [Planctomycetota bacterium]|nr:PCRF domain-containing protein [Planctomycetota bacterium]